ncbi:MAG TPA: PfkB family carbohydrate kinase [Candidatus Nanopelagicaceae bacterium]
MNHFERGAVMRAPSAEVRAGGKGIDAARVAHSLNKRAPLLVLLGNLDRDQFCTLLHVEEIDFRYSTYQGNIRVATMYHEINSPVTTIINEEGPTINQSEWDEYLAELGRELRPGEIVASMGSFPLGITEENLAELIHLVHKNDGLIFFDTAPHFLRWALRNGADIVSPNLDEAEAVIKDASEDLFLGESSNGRVRSEAAALQLCAMGAKVAIVHAGALGSALAVAGKTYFVPQIDVVVVSTVGAGDSLAAGFILKSEEQNCVAKIEAIDWKLSLQYGSAVAAAACEKGRSGDVDGNRVEEIFRRIKGVSD